MVERVVSYEITVHVSFPHKCGQFSWCSTLNVEVIVTFLDISLFCCLHDSVVFPETLLSDVGSYIKYSRGAFAPWDPRLADQFAFSPQTSYSLIHSFHLFQNNLDVFPPRTWFMC